MTIDQLRKLHQARPFEPFDIYLADGRKFSVDHPELLGQSPGGRTIGVGVPDGAIEIIDLLLVTNLKPRGGSPKRRRPQ